MTATKEQIIRTVERMDDDSAIAAWELLRRHFNIPQRKISWDDIEEVEPDEIDVAMINEMENNPDCNEFISVEEMDARRKMRQ